VPSPRKIKAKPYRLPAELVGEQIIPLRDAEDVGGMSVDTIEKVLADKIIQLSPKIRGIKLKHILRLE